MGEQGFSQQLKMFSIIIGSKSAMHSLAANALQCNGSEIFTIGNITRFDHMDLTLLYEPNQLIHPKYLFTR